MCPPRHVMYTEGGPMKSGSRNLPPKMRDRGSGFVGRVANCDCQEHIPCSLQLLLPLIFVFEKKNQQCSTINLVPTDVQLGPKCLWVIVGVFFSTSMTFALQRGEEGGGKYSYTTYYANRDSQKDWDCLPRTTDR